MVKTTYEIHEGKIPEMLEWTLKSIRLRERRIGSKQAVYGKRFIRRKTAITETRLNISNNGKQARFKAAETKGLSKINHKRYKIHLRWEK